MHAVIADQQEDVHLKSITCSPKSRYWDGHACLGHLFGEHSCDQCLGESSRRNKTDQKEILGGRFSHQHWKHLWRWGSPKELPWVSGRRLRLYGPVLVITKHSLIGEWDIDKKEVNLFSENNYWRRLNSQMTIFFWGRITNLSVLCGRKVCYVAYTVKQEPRVLSSCYLDPLA